MKILLVAPPAALLLMLAATCSATAAAADPGAVGSSGPSYSPPFVDHAEWVQWGRLSSLRVYPTPAGRADSLRPVAATDVDEAWSEVLALSPDADTPGMRAQFVCHWQFAERAQPGKTSWNLEPWRPVVGDAEMIAARCNPGSAEEPF